MSAAGRAGSVAVVDCGLGNIHSLHGCLARLAPNAQIEYTDDPSTIERASAVVLPGDGAFGACVAEIDRRGLRETLVAAARTKPFFGICVGMQALFEASEEGEGVGLGVLPGTVRRFPLSNGAKVPLMGWLDVRAAGDSHPFLKHVTEETRFYFLNSYYVPGDIEQAALVAEHTRPFAAAVADGDLFATQFHPEKSSADGVRLLAGFLVASGVLADGASMSVS